MESHLRRVLVASFVLVMLGGCSNSTHIQPVVVGGKNTASPAAPFAQTRTQTREPKEVELPTPTAQAAPNVYYQDDNGLRLAIAQVKGQMLPQTDEEASTFQYVVLTLTVLNYADSSRDITGFPFTVWLTNAASQEEYHPEISAPTSNSLWDALEKLNKGTVKKLNKNQSIRGELFFKTPLVPYR